MEPDMTPTNSPESAVLTDEQIDAMIPGPRVAGPFCAMISIIHAREAVRAALSTSHKASGEAVPAKVFDLTDARKIVVDAIRQLRAAHVDCNRLTMMAEDFLEATHAAAKPDELWDQTLQERDGYHEMADKLAQAIAEHFGVDIGEHSSANCPWENAIAIAEANPPSPQPATTPSAEPARTTERHIALREAHHISMSDSYFEARPALDGPVARDRFEAGFKRGFDAAEQCYPAATKQPAGEVQEAVAEELHLSIEEQKVLRRALMKGVNIIDDQGQRDRDWQFKLDHALDDARDERIRSLNLEMDLKRLLNDESTLNGFDIVEKVRRALTSPTPAAPAVPKPDLGKLSEFHCGLARIKDGEYKLADMCSNATMADGEWHLIYAIPNDLVDAIHDFALQQPKEP